MIQIGDFVRVKPNVEDPDFKGLSLGNWVGIVNDFAEDEDDKTPLIGLEWDVNTLKQMPKTHILECIDKGWDYFSIYLRAKDVEVVAARNTLAELMAMQEKLYKTHGVGDKEWASERWLGKGEQGLRIRQVLWGIEAGHWENECKSWLHYLREELVFPFTAKVADHYVGVSFTKGAMVVVTGFLLNEENGGYNYGLLVHINKDGTPFCFPLSDLEVTDQSSPKFQLVNDYVTWVLSRR